MPLLSDAKTCYVGNTPITTIMAGSVKVWPKVEPLPSQIKSDLGIASSRKGQYVTWDYEFTDCVSLENDWSVRYGFSANADGTGSITWNEWDLLITYNSTYWFYSPDHQRLAWATPFTLDNEWDSLSSYVWYQVKDNRTGQTIVNENFDTAAQYVPRPSNSYSCDSVLPIDENITTDVPGDTQKRIWVTLENTYNFVCDDLGFFKVQYGYIDSGGYVYWNSPQRLSECAHVMIWPGL